MASFNPPVQGVAWEFDVELSDFNVAGKMKVNPTISAGDFKLVKENGAAANLATLPTVEPAGGKTVRVRLNATEMTTLKASVDWSDPDNEWCDGHKCILPTE